MPGKRLINISGTTILWEKEETDVSQDNREYVSIQCVGWVDVDALDEALIAIQPTLDVTARGPCGPARNLEGATLFKRSARFSDSMVRVEAEYRKVLAVESGGGQAGDSLASNGDRTSLRVTAVQEPILTHPVALDFPLEERRKLAAYIQGSIRDGWDVETDHDFVALDVATNKYTVEVTFDDTEVTANGITASPKDFAHLIRAGNMVYTRPSVQYSTRGTRTQPSPGSLLNKVGTVTSAPGAPSVTGRDWMLTGINEEQATDDSFDVNFQWELSGSGGYLKQLYRGGSGSIAT